MAVRIFEVGGSVRDRILNLPNKDRDFAVEAESWDEMRDHVRSIASKIFLEKPEHFTIRALVPIGLDAKGKMQHEARDFVLCRKDGTYSDGRHPDFVEAGSIFDDLARRDFTINAMAVELATGELLDPHGGKIDCDKRLLRCVGRAEDRFEEDSLRILRAIRFSITKSLIRDPAIDEILKAPGWFWPNKLDAVSEERIREELLKCFQHNTLMTLVFFYSINPVFSEVIFGKNLWLEPTLSPKH